MVFETIHLSKKGLCFFLSQNIFFFQRSRTFYSRQLRQVVVTSFLSNYKLKSLFTQCACSYLHNRGSAPWMLTAILNILSQISAGRLRHMIGCFESCDSSIWGTIVCFEPLDLVELADDFRRFLSVFFLFFVEVFVPSLLTSCFFFLKVKYIKYTDVSMMTLIQIYTDWNIIESIIMNFFQSWINIEHK